MAGVFAMEVWKRASEGKGRKYIREATSQNASGQRHHSLTNTAYKDDVVVLDIKDT